MFETENIHTARFDRSLICNPISPVFWFVTLSVFAFIGFSDITWSYEFTVLLMWSWLWSLHFHPTGTGVISRTVVGNFEQTSAVWWDLQPTSLNTFIITSYYTRSQYVICDLPTRLHQKIFLRIPCHAYLFFSVVHSLLGFTALSFIWFQLLFFRAARRCGIPVQPRWNKSIGSVKICHAGILHYYICGYFPDSVCIKW